MKHGTPPALRHLDSELRRLAKNDLLRARSRPLAPTERTFASNDYLGLAGRVGAGASRLVVGERREHQDLEAALCGWLGTDSALAFSSGYAANVGAISALAQPGDLIVSDALNHASIIDGCRLSRARVDIAPHLDLDAVRKALRRRGTGRAWVVTESYFSMDADSPDLRELRAICDERDAALVIDEAHALGVFGPSGGGLCADAGVSPDVLIGTLGKSLGSAGAFVTGSTALTQWLWNKARSFVFSTGMSPAIARTATERVRRVRDGTALRRRLHANTAALRDGLRALGLKTLGHGPIVPIVLGAPEQAVAAAAALRRRGVHVVPIRPPTVPAGSARLRVTVTAAHTRADVQGALAAFDSSKRWLGL